MTRYILVMLCLCSQVIMAQSKSISRFRADHKENSNMFFYKSTLRMLNDENNPELAGILDGVNEIRILNYDKEKQKLSAEDIIALKKAIRDENYMNLMMFNEKSNKVDLYSRKKHEKTVGFIALVENMESLILIDLTGSIDVKRFMQLKQKLDNRAGN